MKFDDEINCSTGVSDLGASLEWYQTHLGLKPVFSQPEMGWAVLATPIPGFTLGLSQVENPQPKGGWTPTFGVRDIEIERARLEKANIRFDGPTIEIPGMTKFATFFDPDGNPLMLAQKLAGTQKPAETKA